MRRWGWLVGLACAVGVPQLAHAADGASVWPGFYVGANVGGATSNSDWSNLATAITSFGDTFPPATFSQRIGGPLGGLQAGYNLQSGPFVYGVEVLANIADVSGDHHSTSGAADDMFKLEIQALLTATGRVGYAWDNSLFYLKGGVAGALVKASVSDSVGPTTGAGHDSSWRIGPTVGIGFEYAATPAISIGVEYNYIHLTDTNYELGDATGTYLWNIDVPDIHWFGARLNYHFH